MDTYAKLIKSSYRGNWNTCNTRKDEIKCYVSKRWMIYNLQGCRGDWRIFVLSTSGISSHLAQRRKGKTTSPLNDIQRDMRRDKTPNIIDFVTFLNTDIHSTASVLTCLGMQWNKWTWPRSKVLQRKRGIWIFHKICTKGMPGNIILYWSHSRIPVVIF